MGQPIYDDRIKTYVTGLSSKNNEVCFAAAVIGVILHIQSESEILNFCRAASQFQPLSNDAEMLEKTAALLNAVFNLSLNPKTFDEPYIGINNNMSSRYFRFDIS